MNDSEFWLPISCYEGFYEVSNLGRVRSFHSYNHRPTQSRKNINSHVLKQGTHKKGYKTVVLCLIGQKKKTRLVHILVAEAFIGPCPVDMEVNHINGIKDDNRVENLEYLTRQQNIVHKINVLGKSRGEGQWMAKLTEPQVVEILRLHRISYATNRELGAMFGVHPDTVGAIISGKNWKHIPR